MSESFKHNPSEHQGPLVSVIVPVYNGEQYLSEALQSIVAQSYTKIEIIIVDDGSTDNSAKIAQSFSDARYYYQENQGPGKARNFGIVQSRGELIAFLDQDDLWTPNKLAVQVAFMLENPQIDYVFALQKIFFDNHNKLPPAVLKLWEKEKIYQHAHAAYLPSSLMTRAAVFKKAGLFDELLINTSDFDWFFRAKDLGIKSCVIPEVLLHKRFHGHNSCYQVQLSRSELLKVIRRSVHRRKGLVKAEAEPKGPA